MPVASARPQPKPGFAKGTLTIVSDDDEHLKDFAEYMPMIRLVPVRFRLLRRTAGDAAQQRADRLRGSPSNSLRRHWASLGAVRGLDSSLAPRGPGEFDRQAAVLLRGMYEQWSRDSDAVISALAASAPRSRRPAAGGIA